MAARRSSSSRSGGGRSRRPAPQSSNVPVIIGAGVVVVVILVAVAMMGGDGKKGTEKKPAEPVVVKKDEPKDEAPRAASKNYSAKVFKDPDEPAPALVASDVAKADQLYNEAKKLNEDARRAQAAGESAKFNKLINDSWDKLQEIDTCLSTYTMWLEEASMDDWRVPREYENLQRKLDKYDKLSGSVKRIKPNRR